MDLPKTQFLITNTGMKAFKRRRTLMLFDRDRKPVRPITFAAWQKLQKDYPNEVRDDKLWVQNVWTLNEIEVGK